VKQPRSKVINGEFVVQKLTGVQRMARELVRELDSIVQKGEAVLVTPKYAANDLGLKNIEVVQYVRVPSTKIGHPISYLWESICMSFYLLTHRSVSVNLCGTRPLLRPDFAIIHDVLYKSHPQFFTGASIINKKFHSLVYWYTFRLIKHIFTDSQYTKEMIIKYYKVRPDQITVVGCGWQHYERIDFDDSIYNTFPILKERGFFFSLGSLALHKNMAWVLNAAKYNPDYIFCITGEASINRAVYTDIPPNVLFTGRLSDGQVKTLMRDCKALIFPSFCEGFGLPPLEALSVGAKIIISNSTCLPEVYGDSAIYIDPFDSNVNMDALLKTPTSDPQAILAKYSWKKSAEQIYETVNRFYSADKKPNK